MVPVTARMLAWKQPFIQRVRNSSLVEGPCMDNNRVLRQIPKTRDSILIYSIGRGAFHMRRMVKITDPGAYGKANVGISNDKGGKIPPRHKSKVSRAMPISPGLVRS